MVNYLKALYHCRELLWVWTWRDIKVRYKQSLLGVAWAILQPLSLMVIFSVIFTRFISLPTDGIPYPIFSYSALLPWTFFASSISFAVPSLIKNMNLITKTYFPREIFPISAVAASFVDFLVASVVFIGMMIFYRVPLSPHILLIVIILPIQILLTLGIVLFASAVSVFYRDVRFVVPLGIQLWMYATPIVYPVSSVPEQLRPYYMLNPMAVVIHSYRQVILASEWPAWSYLGIAAAVALTVFVAGYLYFKRAESTFADLI